QTPDVQECVAELLKALRRVLDVEVVSEVRFVSVPENFFEKLGADFDLPMTQGATKGLTDAQVFQLLETAQGDRQTTVMQAAKMTMFNGQKGNIQVGDQEFFVTGLDVQQKDGHVVAVPKNEPVFLGTRLELLPVLSGDRRTVEMQVDVELSQLESAA